MNKLSGYKIITAPDPDRYPSRQGLEGPWRFESGKVLYYDPKEGKYYDSDSDFYVSNEDMMLHRGEKTTQLNSKINYKKKIKAQLEPDKFAVWNNYDEIPALPNIFDTEAEAREAANLFVKRFEQQGYYKTSDGYKVPFTSLTVATPEENEDASFFIIQRSKFTDQFDATWGE